MKTLILLIFFIITSLAFAENQDNETFIVLEKDIDKINIFFDSEKMFTEKESKEIFTFTEAENIKNYWFLYLETDNKLKNIISIAEKEKNQEIKLYGKLLRYKMGFKFLYNITGKKNFEILLDEEDSRYGIPKKSFYEVKNDLINDSEIRKIKKEYKNYLKKFDSANMPNANFTKLDSEYQNFIVQINEYADTLLLKNKVDVIADRQKSIIFPPIRRIMNVGTKRISRRKGGLISDEQSMEIAENLTTGDIIIERKDWYLSNLAFPGFWGHSALFIGSENQLKKWSTDENIDNHFKNLDSEYTTFTEYLRKKYPKVYSDYIKKDFDEPYRILEVLAPGVVWKTSSGSIGNSDYLSVLRPVKLNKLDIAQAIDTAFSYYGRAYDYKFDFVSDEELVCSELIYKSYAPKDGKNGINFFLQQNFNKTYLSPSYLVKDFVQGKYKGVLAFVLFYDGYEGLGKSVKSSKEEFFLSYDRPGLGYKHKPYKHVKDEDTTVKPELYKKYKTVPLNFSIFFGGDNGAILSREKKNTNILSFNLINGSSDRLRGLEIGTFMNYVREDVKGVQLVLGTNSAVKDSYGIQLAGYRNIVAENFTGIQLSAFSNFIGDKSNALQTSIFYNEAGKNNGLQIGIFNKSNNNKGIQLGLINYSSEDSGFPIGLISLTKNPVIQINSGMKGNEVYIGLETGNKKVSNQISFFKNSSKNETAKFVYELGMKFPTKLINIKPGISFVLDKKIMPNDISMNLVFEKEIFRNVLVNTGINYQVYPKDLGNNNLTFQYGLGYRF